VCFLKQEEERGVAREKEEEEEEKEEGARHSASLPLKTAPSHFSPCDLQDP
jgi:hypothetical protein